MGLSDEPLQWAPFRGEEASATDSANSLGNCPLQRQSLSGFRPDSLLTDNGYFRTSRVIARGALLSSRPKRAAEGCDAARRSRVTINPKPLMAHDHAAPCCNVHR
jgi:hypothetical protein